MNVLFSLAHPGYLRNFDSTIRLLAERGHEVQLLFNHLKKAKSEASVLLHEYETQHGVQCDVRSFPSVFWTPWVNWIRSMHDYARYFRPEFRHTAKLRQRAAARVPVVARHITALPLVRRFASGRSFARICHGLEWAAPPDRAVVEYLRGVRPDVLVVSPLVDLGSPQTELVKAARALGIRTALLVHSWDNLTNKGQICVMPDMVAVWNRLQADEAVRIHAVPAARVVVTGAEAYDQWFTSIPSDRREFCGRIGLDASRPYVLYVGSSTFISSDESTFAREWISRVRSATDTALRSAGVLIRPHPQNVHCWVPLRNDCPDNLVMYPRDGANPMTSADRQDLFDSIHHAAAVVGINTSALIDAAILRRKALTILDERFKETQEGTVHFHYLVNHEFSRFVEMFVRPYGLDTPATPRLVQAIEDLCSVPAPLPMRTSTSARYLSLLPAVVASVLEPRRKRSMKGLKRDRAARRTNAAGHGP